MDGDFPELLTIVRQFEGAHGDRPAVMGSDALHDAELEALVAGMIADLSPHDEERRRALTRLTLMNSTRPFDFHGALGAARRYLAAARARDTVFTRFLERAEQLGHDSIANELAEARRQQSANDAAREAMEAELETALREFRRRSIRAAMKSHAQTIAALARR